MTYYVVVSQGVCIDVYVDHDLALSFVSSSNSSWFDYCQKCYDSFEVPADNECFLDNLIINVGDSFYFSGVLCTVIDIDIFYVTVQTPLTSFTFDIRLSIESISFG